MTPTKSPIERLLEKSKELRLAAQESTKIDTFYIGHLLTTAVGKDKIIEMLLGAIEKNIDHYCLCSGHDGSCDACQAIIKANEIAKGVVE